jgi:hypothetical protein
MAEKWGSGGALIKGYKVSVFWDEK